MNIPNSYRTHQDRCFAISKRDPLSARDVIELFRWVREPDEDYVEIANEIVSGAGDYLNSSLMSQIVRFDITDEQALSEIARQRAFFGRASHLLPEILRHLKCNKDSLFGSIMLIDDIHHDFHYILRSDRQDKEKRKIIDCMKMCMETSDRLLGSLDRIHHRALHDFEDSVRVVMKMNGAGDQKAFTVDNFIEQIEMLRDSIEVSLNRLLTEEDYLYLTANQAKMFVVENVYQMSFSANGPKFLTTPGSDFSILCSLVFELVSGKSGESLAGAINRFGRSTRKKQIDQEEAELQAENELDDNDTDNFLHEKKQIANCSRQIKALQRLSSLPDLSEKARSLVKRLINHEKILIDKANRRYGPNIIWTHQMPAVYFDEFQSERTKFRTGTQKLKKLEIELGRLRRALKPD